MSSSSSRNSRVRALVWSIGATLPVALAMSTGALRAQPAAVPVKDQIVRIVTTGTEVVGATFKPRTYEGTGFVVYSAKDAGGARSVIVTAEHVLGYSRQRAAQGFTFTNVRHQSPPVWARKSDDDCQADLKDTRSQVNEDPCRRITVHFMNTRGEWEAFGRDVPIHVHETGTMNRDYGVLVVESAPPELQAKPLVIGHSSALNAAYQRLGGQLPPLNAYGVDVRNGRPRRTNTKSLTFTRDDGGSLVFSDPVDHGFSGGPILLDGKVIAIVSAVQGEETRATPIQVVYQSLGNWQVPGLTAETEASIETARKAIVTRDFGTATGLLRRVWEKERKPEAARLLAKLYLEELESPKAGMDWLKTLAATGDTRAQIEQVLLELDSLDQSDDADERAARGAGADGVLARRSVVAQLSKLAGHPTAGREAVLACLSRGLARPDQADNIEKEIDQGRACGKEVLARVGELDRNKDAEVALVEIERDSDDSIAEDRLESVGKHAQAGSLHAALLFLTSSTLATPQERDQLAAMEAVIQNAGLRDDKVYLVDEEMFRIIDNQPTRSDIIRTKLLLALAHLHGKSQLTSPAQRVARAKQLLADVQKLSSAEGAGSDMKTLPHRLSFLVQSLIAKVDRKPQAASDAVRALYDWDGRVYLPKFALDINVLDLALELIPSSKDAPVRTAMLEFVRDSCSGQKCWMPLTRRFSEFSTTFGADGARVLYGVMEMFFFTAGELDRWRTPDDEDVQGGRDLARKLQTFLIQHKLVPPADLQIRRLEQIQALLAVSKDAPPCVGPDCGNQITWKTPRKPDDSDWESYDGGDPLGRRLGCRISTKEGLFRRGQITPELTLSATAQAWSRQILEYSPQLGVSEQPPTGTERYNIFLIGGREFPAAVRSADGKGHLYIDSTSPDFGQLLEALRVGHNVTVVYRRQGQRTISYEHLSLYGFHAAYQDMLKTCTQMTNLIPERRPAAAAAAVSSSARPVTPVKGGAPQPAFKAGPAPSSGPRQK
jgi:hypothetical protein